MKFLSRFVRHFRRLQWKLTLFYVLTTIGVLLTLEIVGFLISLSLVKYNADRMFEQQISIQAQNISSNFNGPFMNQGRLKKALEDWPIEVGTEFDGFSMVTDPDGKLIASAGEGVPQFIDFKEEFPAKVYQHIYTALSLKPSEARKLKTYSYHKDGILYIVSPLANEKDVRGVLVVKAENIHFSLFDFWKVTFQFFGFSILVFLIGAAIVGITFGIITSRSFVRRIQKILNSTDRWSQGDFTTFVHDPSKDELGQLARKLNQMAKQLRTLLRVREDLATLEERNRLARELHDSIKQQLFATSIWLNTSKSLIGKDDDTAKEHLLKAENVLHQTQRELSALIRELRPVALEGKDLAHALKDYAGMWQEQTDIMVNLETSGQQQVSPLIEETFFRIIQEALNNVARHSQANMVRVYLKCEEVVTLSIQDNGCGFNIQRVGGQGVGLSSMRERVRALKGHIDIQSELDRGVKITVQCKQTDIQEDNKQDANCYSEEVTENGKGRSDFDFNC
ncbi:sensor histidine kinase [Bacillus gaemokensis]|uniref:histidine kinase n=1 Tax=Bacillus gaemokensis TaxID=574375 RepID=A0A073K9X1_9BACI|nr:sensor histidine kinase [Bacillus gaemokensis]KEK24084.1 histidine kinase [Bacillus gaemokensis]KYG32771.1 histidine kinase [Bacillus gaemokensis]